MIKFRIIDNDMGKVMKVPLTGRGTIHGLTFQIDGHVLPELDVSLLEMTAGDGGLGRFQDHASGHLPDPQLVKKFSESYRSFVEPILKSGKTRY